jgi:hypothetical protein
MAGTSLFALIDDIASILDDVAVMSKVAAKKTAGVLGDDLALNAQQVTGVTADRELPVVRDVAIGSLKNKAILVPAALAISALLPWAIMPLLMLGGVYLCYEGFEKIIHKALHGEEDSTSHSTRVPPTEKEKIKGAIRTDFILSAEIIVIALGTVAGAPFGKQVVVLIAVAILMTFGVYGVVALIVKLDDIGLYLNQRRGIGKLQDIARSVGRGLLVAAPKLMKLLSLVGTAAMFMVGGGIITHGFSSAHEWIHGVAHGAGSIAGVGPLLEWSLPVVLNVLAGMLAGAIALALVMSAKRFLKK